MMDSPWEIGYGLAHNDACFQISGTEMYSSLNLIVSSSGFCFMKDRISVILASCPCWSYGPHQSFLLMILVFGLGIFVCLYLFMNFVLERTLKTNFPGTSLANCAAVPLASLDSANFFDNLKTLPFHFVWAILPMLWRRKWQPTPEFLLGELHGERSLVGYSPWLQRISHDWATVIHAYYVYSSFMHWLRCWFSEKTFCLSLKVHFCRTSL